MQEWICFDVFMIMSFLPYQRKSVALLAWMPYVLSLSSFIEMPQNSQYIRCHCHKSSRFRLVVKRSVIIHSSRAFPIGSSGWFLCLNLQPCFGSYVTPPPFQINPFLYFKIMKCKFLKLRTFQLTFSHCFYKIYLHKM